MYRYTKLNEQLLQSNVEIGALVLTTIGLLYYSHVSSYGVRALPISRDGAVIKQLYCTTAVAKHLSARQAILQCRL